MLLIDERKQFTYVNFEVVGGLQEVNTVILNNFFFLK